MRPRLSMCRWLFFFVFVFCFFCPTELLANPTFLNRQAFPLHLGLSNIGRFHNNDLKTFEVWTQWNNPSHEKVVVKLLFTFVDRDSADSQLGEDGKDDSLMSVTETVTIPEQVSNWGKYLQLTAIGANLNQGFDHQEEGAGLELYLDAQIVSVKHLTSD